MRDRYLEVYRSKTRRDASLYPRSVARGHTDVVTSLEPSGGRLFSASWDGTVRVWEAGPERLSRVATIEVGSGVLAVHAAGGMVYAGCADGEVRAYRDAPGFPLAARTRLPDAVAGLSSDHDHLYAAVLDRTVAVLSRDGLEPVRALHVSGGVPEAVAAIGGEVGAGVSVFDYYTVPLPPPPSARPWERLAAAAPALALALAAIALVLRRRRRGG
jgi:WD40 repeat protein